LSSIALSRERCAPPRRIARIWGPIWATVTLELGKHREKYRLSRESLDRGVLLGRYERCAIPALELGRVSRVHLLLVRVGEEVLAIDTASTNGTWNGGKKVETLLLGESDQLSLGRTLHLHWRRLPPGATGPRG